MKAKERNRFYWIIVRDFINPINPTALDKNFFELDFVVIDILGELAEAMKVKSVNGKSPARTLWDRANEGRPF